LRPPIEEASNDMTGPNEMQIFFVAERSKIQRDACNRRATNKNNKSTKATQANKEGKKSGIWYLL